MNEIDEGKVRIIQFEESILKNSGPEEREDVGSMMGETFEVEEIDEYGCAWITKWWDRGGGRLETHSLGLASNDMVKVSNDR